MRPGQNKRMRGRPSNNRRGPNPLTRSYESNGPDVKIRGNAHHVAEKYLQLARDAHTGGDPVAAENYLQHAEHYFRLIASAQAAQLQAQGGGQRPPGEAEAYEYEDDDDFGGLSDRFASPAERAPAPYNPQQQPQPYAPQPNPAGPAPSQQPYLDRGQGEGERQDRGGYQQGRPDRQNRNQERGPRPDRGYQGQQGRDRPREFRPYGREGQNGAEPAAPGLPSFITAAPRVPAAQESESQPEPVVETNVEAGVATEAQPNVEAASEGQARFPNRGRRRRLRSPYGFHATGNPEEGGETPPVADDAPVSE
ncbi:MAG: DUF4167 domain-containing protein [Hyphomicrobiales bacterium]|nr:DUF4167 domain-containing protein [Hyphomicrobiales bacterium]MBV8662173.1 DUF4167 domain-containing protein [Hyphomicrobiales bacterium]